MSSSKGLRPDMWSVMMYVMLVFVGLLAIYSSTYNPEYGGDFHMSPSVTRQVIWLGVCAVLIFTIMFTNVSAFQLGGYLIYIGVALLLIFVLMFGTTVAGSKSWFSLFGLRFQPAELAKYAAALALAKFIGLRNNKLSKGKNVLISVVIILIPMVLILLQNDTGSALVFLAFSLVLYREGLPGFWLLLGLWFILLFVLTLKLGALVLSVGILIVGSIIGVLIWQNRNLVMAVLLAIGVSVVFAFTVNIAFENVLQKHQKDRILVTMGMKKDDRGVGYNVRQSQIAIGSGQLTGKGFLNGTQTKLGFVPEQSTDFIFCTIAEESGFVGSSFFLILFLSFLGRLVYLAERQHSVFSRVFGYSIVSVMFFHLLINIGMTIGVIPVIGIPLPFISYGGSSLLGFTLMVFTFLRLDSNRINEINRAQG
jgi:rod shape determining protein RodA